MKYAAFGLGALGLIVFANRSSMKPKKGRKISGAKKGVNPLLVLGAVAAAGTGIYFLTKGDKSVGQKREFLASMPEWANNSAQDMVMVNYIMNVMTNDEIEGFYEIVMQYPGQPVPPGSPLYAMAQQLNSKYDLFS